MRASDEHAFVLRRERLVEKVRAFACGLTLLRELLHLLGTSQTEPMPVLTLGTLALMMLANIVSFTARRYGTERAMAAAPLLTLIDTAVVVFVVAVVPSSVAGTI